MSEATTQPQGDMSKILLGAILAWIAVLIYASSNSIVSLLAEIGRENKVYGRNAITYCNLLFVGSLMSMVPMVFMFWRDWTLENLKKLTLFNWVVLTVSAFLSSALTPGLFFYALERTTVTNVVLVGRIEPPLFLLATVLFLKEEFDGWAFVAGLVALIGAFIIISNKGEGAMFEIGKGEIGAALATLSFIASTLVARVGLRGIPLGIFSIYRTALGTVFYFFLAMYLFGPKHFQDVLQPVVWQWVWIYAFVVIICGQFTWALGLKYARSSDVSLATSFSPLAAILIAMLMLGEDPGAGLYPGAAVILLGVAIGQFGRYRRNQAEKSRLARDESLKLESGVNFKGA